MEIRRYFILPIIVRKAGQVIPIDQNIPAHIISCRGILATVKGFLQTGHEIQHIGEISIQINSGEVHPMHHSVGYADKPLLKCNHFMQIEEQITPDMRISGYYQDAATAKDDKGIFLPYQVNVYLDCKAKK
jgi:hypothetical protein